MSSSINFFSRGSVSAPNTRFHMVGIIESGTELSNLPTFLQGLPNTAGKTNKDIYFLLCMNNFLDSFGNKKQRVFWSCDPTDFVTNYNSNSQNQGPVQMEFNEKRGSNNYGINFFSSKKNNVYTLKPSFSNQLSNNPSDIQIDNRSGTRFDINIANNNFNLSSNQVYLSVPYDLVPDFQINSVNTDIQYNWCFRKIFSTTQTQNNITIDSNTSYTSNSLFSYTTPTGINNPLFNINVPKITFGTTSFTIYNEENTLNGVTEKYFRISNSEWTSQKSKFELINKKNGIIKFLDNTDTTSFMYLKFSSISYNGNEDILFKYSLTSDTHMYGKINIIPLAGSNSCQIEYEIRNEAFGFDIVPSTENIESFRFSNWFKIYFIPAINSAVFPGGFTLGKTEFYSLSSKLNTTSVFTIYNPNDGENTTGSSIDPNSKFQQYFYREFSTFFVLNLLNGLNSSYWTSNSESDFPNIAINPLFNENTKSTIFTWTTQGDAHHDFMYSYCSANETCGYCFGNGQETNSCVLYNDSKKNASLVGLGDSEKPVFLTSNQKNSLVKQMRNKELVSLYVLIGIFSLLFLVIVIIVIYFARTS